MRIELFCDKCENSVDFEKVRVIEVYDAKDKTFKPPIYDTIYIRCKQCGSVDRVAEVEEDE